MPNNPTLILDDCRPSTQDAPGLFDKLLYLEDLIGGGISGLTTNKMVKALSATSIGNSLLTDDATTLDYNGGKFTVAAASGNAVVAGTLSVTGAITEGGANVLSGAITANTIPKGSGGNLADSTITDDGTTVTISGALSVLGNATIGDASTDRVGIGIAPDANHAMTFAAVDGNKIALKPFSATEAWGFGTPVSGGISYSVPAGTAFGHSFGVGDADALTRRQLLGTDGRVWFGDTATTSIDNNLDVLTIGNTGTGQTASNKALLTASNTGTYDATASAIDVWGIRSSVTSTRSAGANNVVNYAFVGNASGAQDNYSFYGQAGTLYNAGNLQIDGNAKLGNAAGDTIAFHGVAGSTQQTVTGSRGGNAALADLLTKLATLGLIVDGTSA